MDTSFSLRRFAVASLLCLSPSLVSAQEDKSVVLQTCLDKAGVNNVIQSDPEWTSKAVQFQQRIQPKPACIAFPETRDEIALSLDCARNASVNVNALGPANSFQGFGFGNPGNLIVNMKAFDSYSYDEATTLLTFGGASHVGPVCKYLWDTAGRHIPHVRGAFVGVTGSSIGGGYGSTSRHAGTPMDNIVAVEYMLYNGTIVKAEAGSDLLWAAQGAGASFGIIISMTTKTHKPKYETAINYTLSVGDVSIDDGARALLTIQDFALNKAPNELALRWTLTAPPYTGTGYFYGNPAKFDEVMAPLMKRLKVIAPGVTLAKTEQSFWDMEVSVGGAGMNHPQGGSLGSRAFYTQALTTTADRPLTYDLVRTLFRSTTYAFNRTDLRKSGFLDLWGGVSRQIKDSDTAYAHGNNLWLIRWDATAVDVNNFPADGTAYSKSLMKPFEEALVESGYPLRGFVNYADTELTEAEWSSRLYGKNYPRLQQIKAKYDPEAMFTSHRQSIPLP